MTNTLDAWTTGFYLELQLFRCVLACLLLATSMLFSQFCKFKTMFNNQVHKYVATSFWSEVKTKTTSVTRCAMICMISSSQCLLVHIICNPFPFVHLWLPKMMSIHFKVHEWNGKWDSKLDFPLVAKKGNKTKTKARHKKWASFKSIGLVEACTWFEWPKDWSSFRFVWYWFVIQIWRRLLPLKEWTKEFTKVNQTELNVERSARFGHSKRVNEWTWKCEETLQNFEWAFTAVGQSDDGKWGKLLFSNFILINSKKFLEYSSKEHTIRPL